MTPDETSRTAKAQIVRALDVVLIGPLMFWGGYKLYKEHEVAGGLLALLGVTTVWYNARNYLRVERARNEKLRSDRAGNRNR